MITVVELETQRKSRKRKKEENDNRLACKKKRQA